MNPLRALFGNVGMAMARVAGMGNKQGPPDFAQVMVAPKLFSPASAIPYAVAYEISPDVFSCVSLLAQTIAGLELELFIEEDGKKTPIEWQQGNALDVWGRANPQQTDFEMVEALTANLLTFGNQYLLKERFRASFTIAPGDDPPPVAELWPLPSAFMRPDPGPNRTIRRFLYMHNGQLKEYAAEDVVFGRFWSTGDEVEGLSPLAVARWRYHTQENGARYVNEMYKRGGGMQGVLSTKVQIDKEQEAAFLERLRKRLSQVRQWFEPQFFPAELDWHPTASSLKDMQFVEIAKLTTSEIAKIYRVPADLIGVDKSGALNSASVESSMLLLIEFGVKPLLTRLQRLLDERLWPDFKLTTNPRQRVRCHFNTSRMLPLMAAFLDQAKALREVIGKNFMAPSEGRKILELEERDDEGLDEISNPEPPAIVAGPADPEPPPAKGPAPPQRAQRLTRDAMRDAGELQTERAENRAVAIWGELLDAQEERIRTALRGIELPAPIRAELPEIEAVVAQLEDAADREALRTFLERLVEATGRGALDVVNAALLGEAVAFDVQALAVRRFLKEHLDRAINVPNDTTRRLLRLAIADAWQEGASPERIDQVVQDVFEVRRSNVRTIARTEIVPALNFASLEAYKQTGLVREVEWITARDESVRDFRHGDEFSHALMDGKVAALGGLWEVPRRAGGTETLRYPGDPQGSAGNIINCRCRVVPVIPKPGSRRSAPGPIEARVSWWFDSEGPQRRVRASAHSRGNGNRA